MADETDILSDLHEGGDDAPAAAPNADLGLRDTLTAAFKQADGSATDQGGASNAQPRHEDGRFAPKEQQAAQPENNEQQQAPQEQAPQQTHDFGRWFAPEHATAFASLPAEVQQAVAQTMEGVEQAFVRFEEYDAIEKLIGPRRQPWALNGQQPAQALQTLFALSDYASTQPADFIRWFAGQQNLDLEAIALDESAPQQQLDPVISGLQQQVQQLTGQVQQFTSSQQQQAHNDTVNGIVAFGEEKGADGNLLRPYFSQMGQSIVPYVHAAKAANPHAQPNDILQSAYEQAVWAIPEYRAKMLQAQEAQRLTEQRTRAAQAKNAGASVNGAPSSGVSTPNNADRSLRETLQSAFAASRGNV